MEKSREILTVWKKRGETLAVLLERVRREQNLSEGEKVPYAGRLDPMAEGVVVILCGDARFEKDTYLRKQKTYEVEILFGIATDTLDPLGVVSAFCETALSHSAIDSAVRAMTGITTLPYPLYSSRPVNGVPLFVHARKGAVVAVPDKNVTIYDMQLLDTKTVSLAEYARSAIEDIDRVVGDFRQNECATSWEEVLKRHADASCTSATISVTASSGTYMRSLARWCGEKLGVPAIAYRITRTKIGE